MKKLVLPLLLVFSVAVFAQETTTPKMVIEKYLEAIGGQTAITGIKDFSMEVEGEVQGQSMSMIVKKKMPNKFSTIVTVGGMGEVNNTVFDGKKGKTVAMGQEQLIEGDDAKKLEAQASIIGEYAYLEDLGKLTYVGKEALDGVECHVIKIINAVGEAKEYYEVATGLKKRQINEGETPMGKMTITIDYADYKDVSGIKFPHSLKQDMGMMAFELKAKEIKVNSNLADTLFEVK
jgi:zinc protease